MTWQVACRGTWQSRWSFREEKAFHGMFNVCAASKSSQDRKQNKSNAQSRLEGEQNIPQLAVTSSNAVKLVSNAESDVLFTSHREYFHYNIIISSVDGGSRLVARNLLLSYCTAEHRIGLEDAVAELKPLIKFSFLSPSLHGVEQKVKFVREKRSKPRRKEEKSLKISLIVMTKWIKMTMSEEILSWKLFFWVRCSSTETFLRVEANFLWEKKNENLNNSRKTKEEENEKQIITRRECWQRLIVQPSPDLSTTGGEPPRVICNNYRRVSEVKSPLSNQIAALIKI